MSKDLSAKKHQRPLRAIIVGFGASARTFHAPVLSENPAFSIAGFVERGEAKATALYPQSQSWKSLEEALDRNDAEIVIICTPNATHRDMARIALQAGRHVVVEKPFTVYSSEADELIDLARRKSRLLTVFHSRRLDGDFLTLQALLKSGKLGRIVEFESRYERWSPGIRPKPWKEAGEEGSTLLDDLASHLIDQAVMLFGAPKAVWCNLGRQRDHSKSDDAFRISLLYPNNADGTSGPAVTLVAGMLSRHPLPRFTVNGTKGSYVKMGMDPQESQLNSGLRPGMAGYGQDTQEKWGIIEFLPETVEESGQYSNTGQLPQDYPELDDAETLTGGFLRAKVRTLPGNYALFYENLAECIRAEAPLLVPANQAAGIMRIIEACRKSHRESRVVSL